MEHGKIYFNAMKTPEYRKDERGRLEISGWSVHSGIYQQNTIEIPANELHNVANTLKGKKIFKDHHVATETLVGKIEDTKVAIDNTIRKKGVKYKATIKDQELEDKIKDGYLENMSIGFSLTPECSFCGEDFRACEHFFDEAHIIARDINCFEQSIVPIGADGTTTIDPEASFSLSDDFKSQFEYKNPNRRSKREDKLDEILNEVKALRKNKREAPETKKEDDLASLNEAKIRYFYEPRHAYYTYETNQDGDRMDEELKTEIEKLKSKLSEKEGELEAAKDEMQAIKEDFEQSLISRDQEIASLGEELDKYYEQERLQKIEEIVRLKLEKGLISEEGKEEAMSELKDKTHDALAEIKSIVQEIPAVKADKAPGEFASKQEDIPEDGVVNEPLIDQKKLQSKEGYEAIMRAILSHSTPK